jgi:hypothetical protein
MPELIHVHDAVPGESRDGRCKDAGATVGGTSKTPSAIALPYVAHRQCRPSDRLRAQPNGTTIMARSRRPFNIVISGTFGKARACLSDRPIAGD